MNNKTPKMQKIQKIHNSVFGLAIGDSIGYPTEFLNWANTVEYYKDHVTNPHRGLVVTDDTQMSIAMIDGIRESIINDDYYFTGEQREFERLNWVGAKYVEWAFGDENDRAPGNATMEAMHQARRRMYRTFETIEQWKNCHDKGYLSKGSGTVMRSVWLGCELPAFADRESEMFRFCVNQSLITHGHPTAVLGAWLTTKIAMELFEGRIELGGLRKFALDYMEANDEFFTFNDGATAKNEYDWSELREAIIKTFDAPDDYKDSDLCEVDPAQFAGRNFTAETVLATALMLADIFGKDSPFEALERAMVSMGDTDTIGAVTGGLIGLGHTEPIWANKMYIIEENYMERLENTVNFMARPLYINL